jgi:hypothetical protein
MDPGINNMKTSWSQGFTPWNDDASADWPREDLSKSNDESLYDGGDDYWGAAALPDWSSEHTAQRSRKPKDWCNGCQCEHPRPKDGYTFHVRSRRANAYLRSLQLAGEVPNINPMNVEPLAEVSEYRVSKDAHKMGRELLKRLRGDGSKDSSAGGCCFHLLVGFYLDNPGYASFTTPSNAEEFLSSAEGADPVIKWNEFFELIHKQHQESFPAYYTPHTGGVPRYFYQRFPLLAEQAQWAYGYGKSDSQVLSHGQPSPSESDQNAITQVSRDRPASDRGGRRRHVKEQRQVVMKSGRSNK